MKGLSDTHTLFFFFLRLKWQANPLVFFVDINMMIAPETCPDKAIRLGDELLKRRGTFI